jgi:tetratricopeptide (TPR) repeat protein
MSGNEDHESIREELARVLASEEFAGSPRLRRFLSYIVEKTLEGRAKEIKEYALAVEVFDRDPKFDSRTDTIVRVEARRLRHQLAAFYSGDDNAGSIRIDLPKGGYTPVFEPVDHTSSESRFGRKRYLATGAALCILAFAIWTILRPARGGGSAIPTRALNPVAQTHLWEARYFRAQRTPDALEKSIEAFEQAVVDDPRSAEAHSGLASACAAFGFQGLAPNALAVDRAAEAARKAISIDPRNAEAHAVLGWIAFFFDRNWTRAEDELRTAIELNPQDATAHEWYAFGLAAHARFDEAIVQSRRAADLDATLGAGPDLAVILYFSGRYQEAADEAQRVLRIQPQLPSNHVALGTSFVALGDSAAALAEYRKALGPSDRFSSVLGRLGYAYGRLHGTSEAIALKRQLLENASRGAKNCAEQALVCVGLGENGAAMEALMQADQAREPDVLFLAVEPLFLPLRSMPEFQHLCERVGLPLL